MASTDRIAPPLPGIEHVVVLMFENRSFDNVLGRAYPRSPTFDGVPLDATNSYSRWLMSHTAGVTDTPPSGSPVTICPCPDPGESFDDMTQQIFGSSPGGKADMSGFAANYAGTGLFEKGDPGDIMVCFRPDVMPVSNYLARHYAVCDQWFASGPVQTFPNRMFCHCATPGTRIEDGQLQARLNDSDYIVHLALSMNAVAGAVPDRSVFELFDGVAGPDAKHWKVYYHDAPMSIINAYVNDALVTGSPCVANYDASDYDPSQGTTFADDVANDRLPSYAFIEPRYFDDYAQSGLPANSNHPGKSGYLGLSDTPVDVRDGEALLADVFKTLAEHPAVFDKTLLIVTYDEHGGLYDHVPPPDAVSPFADPVAGFAFTRYGVRVPAFFVNPRIMPHTVYRPEGSTPCDHTSIIATLCAQFGLPGPLTRRDAAAPTLTGLVHAAYDEDDRTTAALAFVAGWQEGWPAKTGAPAPQKSADEHVRMLSERASRGGDSAHENGFRSGTE